MTQVRLLDKIKSISYGRKYIKTLKRILLIIPSNISKPHSTNISSLMHSFEHPKLDVRGFLLKYGNFNSYSSITKVTSYKSISYESNRDVEVNNVFNNSINTQSPITRFVSKNIFNFSVPWA